MSEFVQLSIDRGVARMTLDRSSKRNALRRDMIQSMLAGVGQVALDPAARVFVLAAHGDVFCAGMDLGQMQERATHDDAEEQYRRDSEVYRHLLIALFELSIPTIALVQGPALAGGMGLVCACDMVVAAEAAFFMLPETTRGITAAMVTPLLIHRIGPGPASYLLLSNEKVGAIDARRMGLCHAVVSQSELESRADSLVQSVLGGAPAALSITKQHIADCLKSPIGPLLEQSMDVSARARATPDAREGLAAFLEKRKPEWQP